MCLQAHSIEKVKKVFFICIVVLLIEHIVSDYSFVKIFIFSVVIDNTGCANATRVMVRNLLNMLKSNFFI